jgi:murein DD-endopeptidase MepM/ murein hydrolase activator NlpD
VAFYAHLKQAGVLVEVGENVTAGQTIALAGHSGTTDVVHLHFSVYEGYPPVEGEDLAINFRNMDGPVDCPQWPGRRLSDRGSRLTSPVACFAAD